MPLDEPPGRRPFQSAPPVNLAEYGRLWQCRAEPSPGRTYVESEYLGSAKRDLVPISQAPTEPARAGALPRTSHESRRGRCVRPRACRSPRQIALGVSTVSRGSPVAVMEAGSGSISVQPPGYTDSRGSEAETSRK